MAAGGADGGAPGHASRCILCQRSDPVPIESGCFCQGNTGLAHIDCRIQFAAREDAAGRGMDGWAFCPTCNHRFHGPMAIALGQRALSRVEGRVNKPREWMCAAMHASAALVEDERYEEAEDICRRTLLKFEAIATEGDQGVRVNAISLYFVLARALTHQGRREDASAILAHCAEEYEALYGFNDKATLEVVLAFGQNLYRQGLHGEAIAVIEKAYEVANRYYESDDPITIDIAIALAKAWERHGENWEEAIMMYDEYVPIMRQVYGRDHPRSWQATVALSWCVASHCPDRVEEAEARVKSVLDAQMHHLGADHPTTQNTFDVLENIRSIMRR